MMNKIRQFVPGKILLAVDGSPPAKAAACATIQIASTLNWKIHALYVVDVTQVFDVYTDISQELSELGREMPFEQKCKLFEEQGTLALDEIEGLCQEAELAVTTEMIFGGIPENILRISKDYDLLAIGHMGNRHAKDPRHLGKNFQHVAHHLHIPLLIGNSHCKQRNIQRVLLAYDGNQFSHAALAWAECLQSLFQSITILSVERGNERDHTWLADLHEEVEKSVLTQYEFIRAAGVPGPMIASKALDERADLILMGAYQHANLLRWARHSTIDTVLRETDLPILAIK